MSRTVCAVTEKYVVVLGAKCHVSCVDAITGEFRWMMDLVRDYGAVVPLWYAGQCPLIEEGRVILAGGSEALMMAVACETGEIVWQTPNTQGWKMTHSSIIPMQMGDTRMYVYCASGGVVGVAADDGRLLWENSNWRIQIANVPSPVIVNDGRIFLCGGYNAGSMMLQVSKTDTGFTTETLFRLEPKVFGSAQHTPILFEDHLYGVRPDERLVCLDLQGKVRWTSGVDKFGLGPYLMAQGLIYVMDDHGLLTMVEATSAEYRPLARAQVLDGPDSWGPMALAAGRLIVRDLTDVACLKVSE